MCNMCQIVYFGPISDGSGPDRAAINAGVGANLDIIAQYDSPQRVNPVPLLFPNFPTYSKACADFFNP